MPLRFGFYLLVVAAILLVRFHPEGRRFLPSLDYFSKPSERLVIAGLDTAPTAIPALVSDYGERYPDAELRISGGGTLQALEDLVNRRADVAFLLRPPAEREWAILRETGDSVLCFPVALAAVEVVAGAGALFDSLDLTLLQALLTGSPPTSPAIERAYFPEPNSGLWEAVSDSLLGGAGAATTVVWVAGDREVLDAVVGDPRSIGFVSAVSSAPLERSRVRTVALARRAGSPAFTPTEQSLAVGDYPLFHYLYVSCRPDGGPSASAFVTHLWSGRGQRLMRRAGFLPAREVARLIEVVSRPIGTSAG